MPKIEAVIFDWAGTTVDYGCFAPVKVFMEIFRERDILVTEEETRKPMGMLKRDHIKTMLAMERIDQLWQDKYGASANETDIETLYGSFEPMLLALLHEYAAPKPGVLEVVEKLKKMGIGIGSTTGYTDRMMEIVARNAKRQGYAPDYWITPDSVGSMGRPYPYMIFQNMQQLGAMSVNKVVKVGDTISDILEGKNAGVWSVGVIEGSSEMGVTQAEFEALTVTERMERCNEVRERYQKAGADFIIDDLLGIFAIIEEIEREE